MGRGHEDAGPDHVIRTVPGVPASEFAPRFVQGMYDRMAMSFTKYGLVADAYPHRANAVQSLLVRLIRYCGAARFWEEAKAALAKVEAVQAAEHRRATHNLEYLMDAANFAMIEFMRPSIAEAHFTPTDSEGSPGRVFEGELSQRRNDAEVRRLYQHGGD